MTGAGGGVWWLPHVHWGVMIGVYLFLGGVAGGSYVTGYAGDLLRRYSGDESEQHVRAEVSRWGMIIALGSIAVGGLALISHLGAPLRALTFAWNFTNYGSWMTIGTWIIVIFAVLVFLQLLLFTFGREMAGETGASLFPRWILAFGGEKLGHELLGRIDSLVDRVRPYGAVHAVGGGLVSLVAVGLVVYTGLLLSAIWTVPLWNQSVLPLLFLASGVSTGISATIGVTAVFEGLSETVHQFSLADDVVLVAELGVLGVLLTSLQDGGLAASETLAHINGDLGLIFWGGVVAGGLLVPIVLSLGLSALVYTRDIEDLSTRASRLVTAGFTGKYALVLVGGLLLRFVILFAAVRHPLAVSGL